MKKWILRCRVKDKTIFEAIKQGIKTIETRAATDKYRKIKIGDILIFVCGKEKLKKEVQQINYFGSIESMVNTIDFKKIMPSINSIKEMKKIYYSFPEYHDKIKRFGIITMKLK